jgi:hypothetical protein
MNFTPLQEVLYTMFLQRYTIVHHVTQIAKNDTFQAIFTTKNFETH